MSKSQTAVRAARGMIPLIAAVAGALVVLYSTPRGASTSPDSMHYLSAARNLVAGQGLAHFTGQPVVLWAPLYPMLLALGYGVGDLLGAEPQMLQAVRLANALLFALVILCAWWLLRMHVRSRALAAVGLIAVVSGYPLLLVAQFVWTELLFVLLTLLFFLDLGRFLRHPQRMRLLALAVWAGLAALLRYPGVAVIGLGCAALMMRMREASLRWRVRTALTFLVLSGAPITVCVLRNYHLTGTLMGARPESQRSLQTEIDHTYSVMRDWLLPAGTGLGYLEAGALLASAVLLVGVWLWWRHGRSSFGRIWRGVTQPLLLWTGGYAALIVALGALRDFDPISDRFLVPVYVPLLLLILMGLDAVRNWLGAGRQRAWAGRAMIVLAALWLWVPLARTAGALDEWRAFSRASDRTYSAWHNSDLMQRVREMEVHEDRVMTNVPLHLLVHAGMPATMVPEALDGWAELRGQPGNLYVVWFDDLRRCDFSRQYCIETVYSRGELSAEIGCTTVWAAEDGMVLRCEGQGL